MRRALIPCLALAWLAATAAAEEGASYDLHTWKRAWKAGAARTVTAAAKMTGLVRAESVDEASGEPQVFEQNLHDEEDYTYVQRCEASDGAGKTTFRVYVIAWRMRDEEEAADESLTGAHLEVAVDGKAWTWKRLDVADAPSRLARKWLEKRFGAKRGGEEGLDFTRLGAPAGPVKVGDTWAGNVRFMDDGMPLDLPQSRVDMRLGTVADGMATIAVAVRLKLAGFPLGEGPGAKLVPWVEGGLLEGTGETRVPLAGDVYEGGNALKATLRGRAEAEGLKVTLTADMQGTVQSRPGGTIPEIKPAEPRFGTQPVR